MKNLLLFACLAGATLTLAATAVVPPSRTNTVGDTSTDGPYSDGDMHRLMLMNKAVLTPLVGKMITGVSFRSGFSGVGAFPPSLYSWDNCSFYMGPGVAPANKSTTFLNNYTGPRTQVRSGGLTVDPGSVPGAPSGGGLAEFAPPIMFTSPYLYNGGHLICEQYREGFNGTSRTVDACTANGTNPEYNLNFAAVRVGNLANATGTQHQFPIMRFTYDDTWATIEGAVTLNDFVGDPAQKSVTVEIRNVGGSTPLYSADLSLTSASTFLMGVPSTITSGSYDLWVDGTPWLRRKQTALIVAGINSYAFVLQNGDVDSSGEVDPIDIDLVVSNFGDQSGGPTDINGSGEVDPIDIDAVISNFGAQDDAP